MTLIDLFLFTFSLVLEGRSVLDYPAKKFDYVTLHFLNHQNSRYLTEQLHWRYLFYYNFSGRFLNSMASLMLCRMNIVSLSNNIWLQRTKSLWRSGSLLPVDSTCLTCYFNAGAHILAACRSESTASALMNSERAHQRGRDSNDRYGDSRLFPFPHAATNTQKLLKNKKEN